MTLSMNQPSRLLALLGIATLTAVVSCSDDDEGSGSHKGGSAGSGVGGTAGAASGKGGTGATTGGTAPTGGVGALGGSAGMAAGSGGAFAGSGGALAGSSGSGGAGGSVGGTDGGSGEGGEGGGDDGGMGGVGGSGPVCVSPLPTPGGGTPPAVVSTYTFDGPGSLNGFGVGFASSGAASRTGDTFISRNPVEGRSCAGSMQLTVPFTIYGSPENGYAQANFTQNWSGHTKLHVAVKIANPGGSLAYLDGIQLYVQSNGYAIYTSHYNAGTVFADFDWHALELDLTGALLTTVNSLGVQLVAKTAAPSGGPAAPSTTVAYIDDIWLE